MQGDEVAGGGGVVAVGGGLHGGEQVDRGGVGGVRGGLVVDEGGPLRVDVQFHGLRATGFLQQVASESADSPGPTTSTIPPLAVTPIPDRHTYLSLPMVAPHT